MSQFFSVEFLAWLNQHATEIDQSNQYADELFQRIANEGVFKIGVPENLGGVGGDFEQVIAAVREISTYSLTAGFISWGASHPNSKSIK